VTDAAERAEDVDAAALTLLREGQLEIVGRLVDASNVTLYGELRRGEAVANCVYKPVAGERRLWDFPHGTLAHREVAAFLVSQATGWRLVPPTVLREGPFGPGMCQLWIEVDESVDLVELARSDHPQLQRMAAFDAVVNNADRKGGHLLPIPGGHVYGCDHGVCFATEYKLRTLLWRWRGRRLAPDILATLTRVREELDGELGVALDGLLHRAEVAATRRRVERLLATRRYPQPSGDWPALPWPPF
jgi:uncharacterized repeat protein (TIGR03843 family)